MADDASLVWAAYATAIATLTGISSLSLATNTRFAIAPPNDFALPSTLTTNQLYQNFALREIVGIVPNESAVLSSTGVYYDEAYLTYMNNAALNTTKDPIIAAEISDLKGRQTTYTNDAMSLRRQAAANYKLDTYQGVDIYTGQPESILQYENTWYPQIQDDADEIARLQVTITQLEITDNADAAGQQLKNWRDSINKAMNQSVFYQDYNMPVMITDEPTVIDVANGVVTANNNPVGYLPAYSIGGSFNTIAKGWSDTFPSSYPNDRSAYLASASQYFSNNMSTSTNTWSNFGYSSSTAATGGGWFIISWYDYTTQTQVTQETDIKSSEFGSGVSVAAWGIGTFDVSKGLWYSGNPIHAFPLLDAKAPNTTISDIKNQITKLVLGYGIEVTFVIKDESWERFYGYISTAKSNGGSVSLFGFLYGSGGANSQSSYQPWDNLVTNNQTHGVTLRAQNFKVPQLLGAVITTISS